MVVDEKLVVEIKSTYDLHKAAARQVYSYLRATKLEVGLLLHFGPEPHFYAQVCRNDDNSSNSTNPRHSNKVGHSGLEPPTSSLADDPERPKPAVES